MFRRTTSPRTASFGAIRSTIDVYKRQVSDDIIPNKVCLIPDLLKTLPYKPFACSAIDALVHATESFLSPHRKTMTSELFSEKAMDMILSLIHI